MSENLVVEALQNIAADLAELAAVFGAAGNDVSEEQEHLALVDKIIPPAETQARRIGELETLWRSKNLYPISDLEQEVAALQVLTEVQARVVEAAKWVASMDHPSPEAKAALRSTLDQLEEK